MLLVAVLMMTACEDLKPEPEEDICDSTIEATISPQFVPSVHVMYVDQVPYTGTVDFRIYKRYCNETISGNYTSTGVTSDEGYWWQGAIYTYDLRNSLDYVVLTYTVVSESDEVYSTGETLYYADVDQETGEIHKTYEVELPWPSYE